VAARGGVNLKTAHQTLGVAYTQTGRTIPWDFVFAATKIS
jgi:hypothetical protein